MANELRFRVRMLAFGQTRKVLIADRSTKAARLSLYFFGLGIP
jgi:hypothetical protein